MGLLTKKRTILAEIESTYGTDPAPTGAANAILVKNLTVTPQNNEIVDRELIKPHFGHTARVSAVRTVACEFEVELAASGTAGTAPAWGPLLRACAFGETTVPATSVTYAPLSAAIESVTIYYNVDGVLHKLTGCRGNVEIMLNVKQIPVLKFSFTGLYNAPSDAALPSLTLTAFQIPKAVSDTNTPTFSFFSYDAVMESLAINMANQVEYINRVNYEAAQIVDRKPEGTAVFEAPLTATKDFFALAAAGTTGALSCVHGTSAGHIITIAAPALSLDGPSYSDSQGIQMLNQPFKLLPSSGNDELSIALT